MGRSRVVPVASRGAAPTEPLRPVRRRRWARVVAVVLSVLVLVLTGVAWTLFRAVVAAPGTGEPLAASPDGATDILLIGLDSRTDAAGDPLPRELLDQLHAGVSDGTSNTDTMILVRIPDDTSRPATAISIPRDAYVDVPGYGRHKINSAYPRGANAERARLAAQGVAGPELDRRADQAGRDTLLATVQELTGASVNHYAQINLVGFSEITTAVGGVPVCLNAAVHDTYSGADFPAGPQTLQGAQALEFVRQRHGLPRGDLDRIVRQQAFLAALAHQVLSAGTLTDPIAVKDLIDATSRYVVLDPGWNLFGFATQVHGLTGGNLSFRTIPTGRSDLHTPEDGDAVQVDPALVRAFVDGLAGGPPAPAPAPAAVTADVRNGTGRTGLAAAVADVLDDRGVVPGALGNAASTRHSEVRAGAGSRDGAEQVARLLGGLPVVTDDSVGPGRVTVVLGRDYRGPVRRDASGTGTSAPALVPGDDANDAPPAPPITADGVPCVD